MPDKNVQLPDGRVVAFPDSMADADIAAVIQKKFPVKKAPLTKFAGTDIPASPSRIPATETGHPEEDFSSEDVKTALRLAGGATGSMLGGPPGGVLGGMAGEGINQLISPSKNPPLDILEQGGIQGAFEGAGKLGSIIGSKLSPVASESLARILRLSPKAFQFGREPAQEVLERGLASGSLAKTAESIGEASKQVTSDLKDVLHNTPGTVNVENYAIDVANQMPGNAGNRFLQVVDDAAQKLGLRNNQLTSLTPEQANALKQEVAKQSRFVEGDLRPTVATAGKMFGGRLKDELVKLAPQASDLLESSANLTEASKSADYAVRAEKAGQSKGLLGGVQVNKPGTYARAVTDSPTGAQALFNLAQSLKDHTSIANALRTAFAIIYPSSNAEETQ